MKLRPYLRRMNSSQQSAALEMEPQPDMAHRTDECFCGYKWKTVLCVAKALSELNVWRSGDVHPGNKDINICCFVCQKELPFLENCVWFSLKGTYLLPQQPRGCCQSQCSAPHTNQSPAPESTKLEDREGESYLVAKLSTCSAGANNHIPSHVREACFRE